jgi:hypothetical protein
MTAIDRLLVGIAISRGARSDRASDRVEPAGTEHGLRDTTECSARTLGAARHVGSTIHEWDGTADRDLLATPRMLPPGRRHFKHAEQVRWAGSDSRPVSVR